MLYTSILVGWSVGRLETRLCMNSLTHALLVLPPTFRFIRHAPQCPAKLTFLLQGHLDELLSLTTIICERFGGLYLEMSCVYLDLISPTDNYTTKF